MLNHQLKQLHITLNENLKNQAHEFEAPNQEIESYRQDQNYYFKRNYIKSNEIEFKNALTNSEITLIGDIHTFDQNIRNVLRIARQLCKNPQGMIMGIEFVHHSKQQILDSYLGDFITELEFLDAIGYHDSWRFPWNHYKLIFELAKAYPIKLKAMNTTGRLDERDQFVAKELIKLKEQNPTTPILLLFGELHIIPSKIPKYLKIFSKKIYRTLIIHQNIDPIYLDNIECLEQFYQFNQNEFCLMTSPPWLKYESMIYWYENMLDDPDFDIHSYILDTGLKIFGPNTEDNFYLLIKELLKGLGLSLSDKDILDFNLLDHLELKFLANKIKSLKQKKIKSFYQHLLTNNETFKLIDHKIYYIPNYSANRLIYLAGVHIQSIFLAENKFKQKSIFKDKLSFFSFFVLQHAHSYFISKIINPYRKCDLYLELEEKCLTTENKEIREQYQETLNLLDKTKAHKKIISKFDYTGIYYISKNIGYLLGEHFFTQMRENKLENLIENFQKYFYTAPFDLKKYVNFKSAVLSGLDYQKMQKRLF